MADSWAEDVPLAYDNRVLRNVELPATQFLVNDRIPYGLWLHSAPPGGYKSAFASQLEHHIAYGHPIPGLNWEFSMHGDCLVISPDESPYEMQDRTYRILPGGYLESDGIDEVPTALPDIHVRHDPHGADLGQRIEWMKREIELIEAKTGRHIVWIRWDTIGNLLGDRNGVDHYTHAMPLQKLNLWMANSHRVMFLPNHLNKNGESVGTVNLTGCANLSTKAKVTRDANTGNITCLEDGTKMRGGRGWSAALVLRNGLLELTDESPQEAAHKLGSMPRSVVDYLAKHGRCTISELRSGTGIADKPLWKCVLRLKSGQEIHNLDGYWDLRDLGQVAAFPPEWHSCDACSCKTDPERGCVNRRCPQFVEANWAPAGAVLSAAMPPVHTPEPCPIAEALDAECVTIPAQAPAPELEAEPVPEIGGNPAVDKLIELVKTSPLYAVRRLAPEMRAQLGYERVCLGGRPNHYQLVPEQAPAFKRVLILDRRAAYFQSCVAWATPNVLHREGDLDYGDVVRRGLAGMFEILYTPWESETHPDPVGDVFKRGARLLVPRPTLDRIMDSVRAGFRVEPEIMYGLCGKGSERGPLYHFGRYCLDMRRDVAGDARALVKEQQNVAFGTLRIADPDKQPGPVDRPDWQYAVIGHHYAQINRYVSRALDVGDPVIAAGNTDEIVFGVPDGVDAWMSESGQYDGWLPESMRKMIETNRFSVKALRKGDEWFADPDLRRQHA